MLDAPVYKFLAHNDTGQAAGHQAGIVIPKAIAPFFPRLSGETSVAVPTISRRLTADLYVNGIFAGYADTRYQLQTWGGTRSPERRLTDNLGPIRNQARADDLVLFVKDLSDDNRIQIHLIHKDTPEYVRIIATIGSRRWGMLDPKLPPVSVDEIVEAEEFVAGEATDALNLFRSETEAVESRTKRLARDRAFRLRVLEEYDFRCAISDRTFATPSGRYGLDASHIIPVKHLGSDHPANGIPLTKDLHWAFDQGLIGVGDDRRVIVPASVSRLPGNEFLSDLDRTTIREAESEALKASKDAFRWHKLNILVDC